MLVLDTLAPVFLLIAVGALLQRARFVSESFLREANRVTYWVGLPALLLSQLVDSMRQVHGATGLLGAVFAATGLLIAFSYLVGWLIRIPGWALGTFVQGALRGNLAFVGLPIVFALPDTPLPGGLALHAAAVLVVAPTMVLYNVAAVVALVLSQHEFGPRMVKPVVRQLAVTPPLLATLVGIGFALAGWSLPPVINRTLNALGEMALPLGLLGVGGSLAVSSFRSAPLPSLAAAALKTLGGPACGWAAARALGLGPAEQKLVLILLACPTAIVSYTMAVEMKGDERLAAQTIAWSVLGSLLALVVVIAAF